MLAPGDQHGRSAGLMQPAAESATDRSGPDDHVARHGGHATTLGAFSHPPVPGCRPRRRSSRTPVVVAARDHHAAGLRSSCLRPAAGTGSDARRHVNSGPMTASLVFALLLVAGVALIGIGLAALLVLLLRRSPDPS